MKKTKEKTVILLILVFNILVSQKIEAKLPNVQLYIYNTIIDDIIEDESW